MEGLREFADAEKALVLQGFFKTGVGEYGEGDIFLGVSVPNVRKVVKAHGDRVSLDDVEGLLMSEIHEERLAGVLILVERFKGDPERIYNFYLANASRFNNWDLVDLSAPKIVGGYLLDKPKEEGSASLERLDSLNRRGSTTSEKLSFAGDLGNEREILYKLARSENLWERRIAIISTFAFIRAGEFEDCLRISRILLKDSHDLIRKAVGWMLREVGKRDADLLREFLRENYLDLSRVTLRYAIERFGEVERLGWLKGELDNSFLSDVYYEHY